VCVIMGMRVCVCECLRVCVCVRVCVKLPPLFVTLVCAACKHVPQHTHIHILIHTIMYVEVSI